MELIHGEEIEMDGSVVARVVENGANIIVLLLLLFQFSDYPIEKTMIGLTAFSPVDLCRILILLQLDVSALMGFTGALFRDFFGSSRGEWVAFGLLTLWVVIPFYFSTKKFRFKDL